MVGVRSVLTVHNKWTSTHYNDVWRTNFRQATVMMLYLRRISFIKITRQRENQIVSSPISAVTLVFRVHRIQLHIPLFFSPSFLVCVRLNSNMCISGSRSGACQNHFHSKRTCAKGTMTLAVAVDFDFRSFCAVSFSFFGVFSSRCSSMNFLRWSVRKKCNLYSNTTTKSWSK